MPPKIFNMAIRRRDRREELPHDYNPDMKDLSRLADICERYLQEIGYVDPRVSRELQEQEQDWREMVLIDEMQELKVYMNMWKRL